MNSFDITEYLRHLANNNNFFFLSDVFDVNVEELSLNSSRDNLVRLNKNNKYIYTNFKIRLKEEIAHNRLLHYMLQKITREMKTFFYCKDISLIILYANSELRRYLIQLNDNNDRYCYDFSIDELLSGIWKGMYAIYTKRNYNMLYPLRREIAYRNQYVLEQETGRVIKKENMLDGFSYADLDVAYIYYSSDPLLIRNYEHIVYFYDKELNILKINIFAGENMIKYVTENIGYYTRWFRNIYYKYYIDQQKLDIYKEFIL